MAAILVNTSEEKSLKNLSLKHHNHNLGKTPSSYRFWRNSWSISCYFRGDVLAIPSGCPGAPLAKFSSYLVNVCSVYLFKYRSRLFLDYFRGHRIILCSAFQHHRIFLWFSSNHRIFLWFSQLSTESSCGFSQVTTGLSYAQKFPVITLLCFSRLTGSSGGILSSNHRIIWCMVLKIVRETHAPD